MTKGIFFHPGGRRGSNGAAGVVSESFTGGAKTCFFDYFLYVISQWLFLFALSRYTGGIAENNILSFPCSMNKTGGEELTAAAHVAGRKVRSMAYAKETVGH